MGEKRGFTAEEIARLMDLPVSAVIAGLERLEKRGLVREIREPDPHPTPPENQ